MEDNLKGMSNYNEIETDQYGVDLGKLIRSVWQLQDNDKQDVMLAVEIN